MSQQQAGRWWPTARSAALFTTALPAGCVLAVMSLLVAGATWFGSSNDGDGPGETAALTIGLVVPLALGVLLMVRRAWRAFGGGFLVGAITADVGLAALGIFFALS